MKATLQFDLPEDKAGHMMAVNAFDAFYTLDRIDNEMREILKYDKFKEYDKYKICEKVREMINANGLLEHYQ